MDAIGSISECVKQMRTLPAISATDLASVREWIEDERRRGFGCERLDHLQQEVDAMYLQQEAEALHGDLRALQDMAASIHCMVTVRGPCFFLIIMKCHAYVKLCLPLAGGR